MITFVSKPDNFRLIFRYTHYSKPVCITYATQHRSYTKPGRGSLLISINNKAESCTIAKRSKPNKKICTRQKAKKLVCTYKFYALFDKRKPYNYFLYRILCDSMHMMTFSN